MKEFVTKLDNVDEFRKILKNYQPSKTLLLKLRSIKFVLLSAPTASGRNTIIHTLSRGGDYRYIVSDTTRSPRVNNGAIEKNGVEYWFNSEHQFLKGLMAGDYLEAAVIHNQQVSGINGKEFNIASQASQFAITDIDVHGCDTIVGYSDTILPLFILPPKFGIWMKRLQKRGKMPKDEKRRRIYSAIEEISLALQRSYFYFITNDDLELTSNTIHRFVSGDLESLPDQEEQKKHARQLILELKKSISAQDFN